MGINRQSDESANLQVGPTTAGMVRIYVASDTVDLPMDFTPEDAEEIARELMAAAETVRSRAPRPSAGPRSRPSSGARPRRRESASRRPR